jgi:hypothetical protein
MLYFSVSSEQNPNKPPLGLRDAYGLSYPDLTWPIELASSTGASVCGALATILGRQCPMGPGRRRFRGASGIVISIDEARPAPNDPRLSFKSSAGGLRVAG